MTVLQAISLGVLQGLTEFLPVSSSGHLVLAQQLFAFREPQLFFDVAVHGGTLLAVLLVFRAELLQISRDCLALLRRSRPPGSEAESPGASIGVRMASMVVIGSIPTGLIGLLFKNFFESLFSSPLSVGLGLWITGLLLVWSRWCPQHRHHLQTPAALDALLVGLAQGAAITPGLSRSGATIAAGLVRGLNPALAFRFSFLLSIPAILGALTLELLQVTAAHPSWQAVAAGFFFAFLVGWVALRLLLAVVERGKLFWFAPYCFGVGTLAFVIAA